jgi:hypothetical protein
MNRLRRVLALMVGVGMIAGIQLIAPTAALADEFWSIVYGDPSPTDFSSANAVTTDSSGNIYVVGPFAGSFQGHPAVDGFDYFVMKVSPGGAAMWTTVWDTASDENIDFSSLESYGNSGEPWNHTARMGDIAVDGNGQIYALIGSSMVSISPAGSIEYFVDVDSLSEGDPSKIAAQGDADGGVLLTFNAIASPGAFVSLDAALDIEWGPVLHMETKLSVVPLGDGGTISVSNIAPQFSFQSYTLAIKKYDDSGTVVWSVAHNGRCLGGEYTEPGSVITSGDTLFALSAPAATGSTDGCIPNGSLVYSAYSIADGSWSKDHLLEPLDLDGPHSDYGSYYLKTCLDGVPGTPSPLPTLMTSFWDDDGCPPGTPPPGSTGLGRVVIVGSPFPDFFMDDDDLVGIGTFAVPGDGGPTQPVLVRYKRTDTSFELLFVQRLTNLDGLDILDIAVGASGVPVVVGRSNGEASIEASHAGVTQMALASNQPQAFIASNPSSGLFPEGDHTVALVDPAKGEWHLRSHVGKVTSFFFGNPGDYPFMGDWDGDGIETPGLYRQSDGYVYLRNTNTQGVADIKFFFGNPGDVPIAGDFNGDGFDTVSIYRPSQARFYIMNALGSDDGGLGAAEFSYVFGNPGDKPFVGDFDGDGIETVGLHRESTGLVYFRNTHTQGNADNQFIFGDPGDRLVAGDWTGDSVFTPALFRPSNTTMYFRFTNTQGNADYQFTAGQSAWLPVAGDTGP